MKFFKKYSNWIIAFIFVCALMVVYKTFDNIAQIFSSIGNVLAVIFSALAPFFAAFVIAYILNMPAKKFNEFFKKRKNKYIKAHSYGISVLLSVVILFVFVILLIATILPILYENIVEITANLPGYISSVERYINSLEIFDKIEIFDGGDMNIFTKLMETVSSIDLTQIGKYFKGVINVTSSIFDIFIAVIASVYMLIDKERLINLSKRLVALIFKPAFAEKIIYHASNINNIFINYIYSRLICGIISGALCGIVLSIIGVKYVILLAIIIAVMDLIPYFGSIISCVISVAVALLTGGVWQAVWAAIALIVIQQIDGNILGPKIMGDSLEIRPLWVIFAVAVGGSLFGFWGMLISVPVMAAAKAVASDWLNSLDGDGIKSRVKETFTGVKDTDFGAKKDDGKNTDSDTKNDNGGGGESE